MYEWFDRVGADADIVGLRSLYPEGDWHRFSVWAREQDWSWRAVRFLITCNDNGVALLHCSPYIRRWMARERPRSWK